MSHMAGPRREIPADLLETYTMDGRVPIRYQYREEADPEWATWTEAFVEDHLRRFTANHVLAGTQGWEPYPGASLLMVESLISHPIKGCSVAVIGSLSPWIEAILVNQGAADVTTVEYNVPICQHPAIATMSYEDFCASERVFDAVVTYSSIEHSGLGRYGDSLDPEGDRRVMDEISRHLRPQGLIYLSVPVGNDVLVWNAHRIYGPLRMAHILEGYRTLAVYKDAEGSTPWLRQFARRVRSIFRQAPDSMLEFHQPIYVLQRTAT